METNLDLIVVFGSDKKNTNPKILSLLLDQMLLTVDDEKRPLILAAESICNLEVDYQGQNCNKMKNSQRFVVLEGTSGDMSLKGLTSLVKIKNLRNILIIAPKKRRYKKIARKLRQGGMDTILMTK